ncbi:unnamed protein product [Urochloa humidicola]
MVPKYQHSASSSDPPPPPLAAPIPSPRAANPGRILVGLPPRERLRADRPRPFSAAFSGGSGPGAARPEHRWRQLEAARLGAAELGRKAAGREFAAGGDLCGQAAVRCEASAGSDRRITAPSLTPETLL